MGSWQCWGSGELVLTGCLLREWSGTVQKEEENEDTPVEWAEPKTLARKTAALVLGCQETDMLGLGHVVTPRTRLIIGCRWTPGCLKPSRLQGHSLFLSLTPCC